jgi:hypothetical protein
MNSAARRKTLMLDRRVHVFKLVVAVDYQHVGRKNNPPFQMNGVFGADGTPRPNVAIIFYGDINPLALCSHGKPSISSDLDTVSQTNAGRKGT